MLIRSRAPLRLGFAGGGSDVSPYSELYEGHVLNATIDMYAYCIIEPWDKGKIIFSATDREETFIAELQPYLDFNHQLDLHKAVYNRVVREFNKGESLGLKMTTYSDAPAGSGLGSSSTLVVAMLSAYVEWLKLPLGEYDIARIAYEIERIELGLAGGRQDGYAATFGGFNFIEFGADERVIVNPLRIKSWMVNELESSLVLYYTDAPRESAKILKDQIKNVKTENHEALEATHEIKRDALLMKEAILKGSLQSIAKILGRSWEAKKKLASSISNPVIEHAYEVALKAGAYSGKISGAGGGGFIIFMVDPTRKMDVVRSLNKLNGSVKNFHFVQQGVEAWTI